MQEIVVPEDNSVVPLFSGGFVNIFLPHETFHQSFVKPIKTQQKMNKKAFILAGLCVFGLCVWQTQAAIIYHSSSLNSSAEDIVPHGYDDIVLQGTLMYGVGQEAIVAGVSDNAVYIHFNQSFGNVSVKIYNDAGCLVYCSEVNTSVQQTFIIPIMGGANGHFVLELNNANGFAEGEFTRN